MDSSGTLPSASDSQSLAAEKQSIPQYSLQPCSHLVLEYLTNSDSLPGFRALALKGTETMQEPAQYSIACVEEKFVELYREQTQDKETSPETVIAFLDDQVHIFELLKQILIAQENLKSALATNKVSSYQGSEEKSTPDRTAMLKKGIQKDKNSAKKAKTRNQKAQNDKNTQEKSLNANQAPKKLQELLQNNIESVEEEKVFVRLTPHDLHSHQIMLMHQNYPRLEIKSQLKSTIAVLARYLEEKWLKQDKSLQIKVYPDRNKWLQNLRASAVNNSASTRNDNIEALQENLTFNDIVAGYNSPHEQNVWLYYQICARKGTGNSNTVVGAVAIPQSQQQQQQQVIQGLNEVSNFAVPQIKINPAEDSRLSAVAQNTNHFLNANDANSMFLCQLKNFSMQNTSQNFNGSLHPHQLSLSNNNNNNAMSRRAIGDNLNSQQFFLGSNSHRNRLALESLNNQNSLQEIVRAQNTNTFGSSNNQQHFQQTNFANINHILNSSVQYQQQSSPNAQNFQNRTLQWPASTVLEPIQVLVAEKSSVNNNNNNNKQAEVQTSSENGINKQLSTVQGNSQGAAGENSKGAVSNQNLIKIEKIVEEIRNTDAFDQSKMPQLVPRMLDIKKKTVTRCTAIITPKCEFTEKSVLN